MRTLSKTLTRLVAVVALTVGVASCTTGGGPGAPALQVLAFNFAPGFGNVPLNAHLILEFSTAVDPGTVNATSIRILTTTVTTEQPDPGAPANGEFLINANQVEFVPDVPALANLSDAGLQIGFRYRISVPGAPDVISPVRSTDGDPNVIEFEQTFETLNQRILPVEGEITAEPNLTRLSDFFIEEFIENGNSPINRTELDRLFIQTDGVDPGFSDSPQVIFTDPIEGEEGVGTITGIEIGLGTAFVRLDSLTIEFSEPISPWRIRSANITIRNANLGGQTFDLFFFFLQDRERSVLQITVFDASSAVDQASVPQGSYTLTLTQFTDLSGKPLVNTTQAAAALLLPEQTPADRDAKKAAIQAAVAGTFELNFVTKASPSVPTNIVYSFQDDDGDGNVDVGGLRTNVNDPNLFSVHLPPFLGGAATDTADPVSPSLTTTSANWGGTGYWNGRELQFNNGFDPLDPLFSIPAATRLRGASLNAATAILAPIAGDGSGPSDPVSGTLTGSVAEPGGKRRFEVTGNNTVRLFTGDENTGPIVYHYSTFTLTEAGGSQPTLSATNNSIFPLLIMVEGDVIITGIVDLDGGDGEFGFDGDNTGANVPGRLPGGDGGFGIAGGGDGGAGGANEISATPDELSGTTGSVGANLHGPLAEFSEENAGIAAMITGGGGHYDQVGQVSFQGGGGGHISAGGNGGDLTNDVPGTTDQGVGGQAYGNEEFTDETGTHGGSGGGGGGADDDSPEDMGVGGQPNNLSDQTDDGGGGGGAGGGFVSITCGGDMTLGDGTPMSEIRALFRANGGRGGSTYQVPGDSPPADPTLPRGAGGGGGGGAGGGVVLICEGQMDPAQVQFLVYGKKGGNSPDVEAGGRTIADQGGNGGQGALYLADTDGIIQGPGLFLGFDPDEGDPEEDTVSPGLFLVTIATYGDDAREPPVQGVTRIVGEFFDTLSDNVTYNSITTLSNAPDFPPDTIVVFLDSTIMLGSTGLPNLNSEDPDGTLGNGGSPGATLVVTLNFDENGVNTAPALNRESRFNIPGLSPVNGKRYARVRVEFDLAAAHPTLTDLLTDFAPRGALPDIIAPGSVRAPNDSAAPGVPAVADLLVTFTPGPPGG